GPCCIIAFDTLLWIDTCGFASCYLESDRQSAAHCSALRGIPWLQSYGYSSSKSGTAAIATDEADQYSGEEFLPKPDLEPVYDWPTRRFLSRSGSLPDKCYRFSLPWQTIYP